MSKPALWSRYHEGRPARGCTVLMLSAADICRGLKIPRARLASWICWPLCENPLVISDQGMRPPVEIASRSTAKSA